MVGVADCSEGLVVEGEVARGILHIVEVPGVAWGMSHQVGVLGGHHDIFASNLIEVLSCSLMLTLPLSCLDLLDLLLLAHPATQI